MKILAISRHIENSHQEMNFSLFVEEIQVVWKLYQTGFIREFYSKANEQGVVLMLEGESVDEAQKKLLELPFDKLGIIEFECIQLDHFSLLSALFKEQ